MKKIDVRHLAAIVATAALLSACGGSDGDPVGSAPPPGEANGIPSSALQSVTALVSYAREMISGLNDTAEPIALGNATLPTSETAEPIALN